MSNLASIPGIGSEIGMAEQSAAAGGLVSDVVIFGASGFTGRRVLLEFLRVAGSGTSAKSIAIAGRSRGKLETALSWALGRAADRPSVPIFEADVADPASLSALCGRARLVINCVGPYRLYGEPVVAACVEAGIDYLDVTGEPEFMERMEVRYHGSALERGSLVVSACGFDSVPAEMGVIFNTRQWAAPSQPNSIDAYVALHSSKRMRGNFATFESAVLGIANVGELQKLRKANRRPKLQVPGAPLKRSIVHWEDTVGAWAVKLPSADAMVVRRTLATVAENPQGLPMSSASEEESLKKWAAIKPVHFGVYLTVKNLLQLCLFVLMGWIMALMASFRFGRKLLLSYPEIFTAGVFSKTGPSQEEIDSASFTMWFVGRGFNDATKVPHGKKQKPDKEIVTRVTGPEIGYVTTPIIVVQAALLVLDERKSLPKGGVLTPGAAFGVTDFQERLQKNGISFEVVSTKTI